MNWASSEHILLLKVLLFAMGLSSQDVEGSRCVIVEFLAGFNSMLPPYWYKLEGDDLGSLAYLFGLPEPELQTVFMSADVVRRKGKGFETRRDNFDSMLSLLSHGLEGVQLEKSKVPDESKKNTRSRKAPPTKKLCFLRVGSFSARGWTSYDKAIVQVKNNVRPP